jgi:hypothetical protein
MSRAEELVSRAFEAAAEGAPLATSMRDAELGGSLRTLRAAFRVALAILIRAGCGWISSTFSFRSGVDSILLLFIDGLSCLGHVLSRARRLDEGTDSLTRYLLEYELAVIDGSPSRGSG